MHSLSAGLMSMGHQLKLKQCRKRKLLSKFAIIITKFMLKFTNGSILDLIISGEQVQSGTPKLLNKYS